jgi:hypothetical protein
MFSFLLIIDSRYAEEGRKEKVNSAFSVPQESEANGR